MYVHDGQSVDMKNKFLQNIQKCLVNFINVPYISGCLAWFVIQIMYQYFGKIFDNTMSFSCLV